MPGNDAHPVPAKGNAMLRGILTQAGQAAGRTRNSYLGATYRRIAARRGRKKAGIAVGRSILEIAYFVLRDGVAYEETGGQLLRRAQEGRRAPQRGQTAGAAGLSGRYSTGSLTPPPLGAMTFFGGAISWTRF